jgi:hypothetical protein
VPVTALQRPYTWSITTPPLIAATPVQPPYLRTGHDLMIYMMEPWERDLFDKSSVPDLREGSLGGNHNLTLYYRNRWVITFRQGLLRLDYKR